MPHSIHAQPRRAIAAAHWQPALQTEAQTALASTNAAEPIAFGVDDIHQSIRIILATYIGSDAHRPDFGSRIRDYLDWPVNRARPHLVRESVHAIRKWEPRLRLDHVQIEVEAAHITICVLWHLADGVERKTQVQHETQAHLRQGRAV